MYLQNGEYSRFINIGDEDEGELDSCYDFKFEVLNQDFIKIPDVKI